MTASPTSRSVRRWKGQSLLLHRSVTAPGSAAAAQGLLPLYAKLAFIIASCAGQVAGMAKKAWRDGDRKALTISKVRSLRSRINTAFDQLEATLLADPKNPVSGILPSNSSSAAASYEAHGNFGILALSVMEESSALAVPLMSVADGSKTLDEARPEISFESADLRVDLHVICEQAHISSEQSTTAKWSIIQKRYPAACFVPAQTVSEADATVAMMSSTAEAKAAVLTSACNQARAAALAAKIPSSQQEQLL